MTRLAHAQRQALCDAFDRLGPDAPTLDEGWTTRDLAAHLATRDRRPDAVPGIGLPLLASWTRKVQAEYAARPWPELVDLVRFGPPAYAVTRIPAVGERVDLAEYYIHHEDVLRAQTPASSVPVTPELERALWALLPVMGRLLLMRAKVGVRLACEGFGEELLHAPTDAGTVTLTGRPGDLLLHLSGRGEAADVAVTGPPAADAAYRATSLGL
ncbi:TIGR03085 family metal-binding protein [Arsenicicoccus dermatophilus]|uniref:TIGR03085 family metal-binding protein n=1 Tax=Arsenicicoccus dermatophilus TaxID=1076331 RepID=UPI001F4C7E43|nr:TIGR03085 family metal-binding protein [Arsenicicoccus dermatophilus]MCH8613113.1 TIGR03085 family metal-binding protein [Arsenicicoccus dermatophilus]